MELLNEGEWVLVKAENVDNASVNSDFSAHYYDNAKKILKTKRGVSVYSTLTTDRSELSEIDYLLLLLRYQLLLRKENGKVMGHLCTFEKNIMDSFFESAVYGSDSLNAIQKIVNRYHDIVGNNPSDRLENHPQKRKNIKILK